MILAAVFGGSAPHLHGRLAGVASPLLPVTFTLEEGVVPRRVRRTRPPSWRIARISERVFWCPHYGDCGMCRRP